MQLADTDRRLLDAWPPELASLPFGSAAFKAANAQLAREDEAVCAPVLRAMPSWINLTSTTVCNLRCFMCNQFLDPNSPKVMMEEDVYQKVVREMYPYAKTMQLSAFGEPLMTPKMEQKLDDLERHGVKLEMVSNATLMMRESTFREKLLANLELVTFSMDGATAATYDSVRTGADYREVVDNISRFCDRRQQMQKDARPRLHFNYILMRRNVAEAPAFVEMVHRWGGDHITFNHLVSFHPSLRGESLNYFRGYANEWLARTRQTAQALGVRIQIPPDFVDVTAASASSTASTAPSPAASRPCGPPPVKCMFLWNRVYIAPNGEVVPCCLAGMPNFGTMAAQPFLDVWNGPTYQDYRKHVFTSKPLGKCRTCYLIWQTPELTGSEGFEY